MLSFRRYVLLKSDGDELFVELAQTGPTVYVRSGGRLKAEREEIKELASEAAATRGVDKRIATLRKQGYLEDGVVSRPAPEPDPEPRVSRTAERAQRYAAARAEFDAALPGFVRAWRGLGFDPGLTFLSQCRGTKLHPKDVLQRCLELVSGTFGVVFSQRSGTYDVEHGAVRPIPAYLLVEFYKGPAEVLTIAYGKLRGQGGRGDDVDLPGFADEVLARMKALPGDSE